MSNRERYRDHRDDAPLVYKAWGTAIIVGLAFLLSIAYLIDKLLLLVAQQIPS